MKLCYVAIIFAVTSFSSFSSAVRAECDHHLSDGLVLEDPGSMSVGRELLQWRSCNEIENVKITATPMKKMNKTTMRRCCVACKDNPPCLAWRWNSQSYSCSLYDNEQALDKVLSKKHTSGFLEWRFNDPSIFQTLAETRSVEVRSSATSPSDEIQKAPAPPAKAKCNDVTNMKITAVHMEKIETKSSSSCCQACQDTNKCLAWRWNLDSHSCSLYDNEKMIDRVSSSKHTSGFLESRFTDPSIFKALTSTKVAEIRSDSPTSGNSNSQNNGNSQNVVPAPPPADSLPGKIIYGRRLNSHLPCQGNIAQDAEDCASRCEGVSKCEAWTFTDGFNCGWAGESNAVGLCYMMSDVDPSNVYDAPDSDMFVSGWI